MMGKTIPCNLIPFSTLETKIYFVAETKDAKAVKDKSLLRDSERMKIACAEKHFDVIDDVNYQVVSSVSDLKPSKQINNA